MGTHSIIFLHKKEIQMKTIHIFLFMLIGALQAVAQNPETIYPISKVKYPHQYYVKQAELWWKQVEKNKSNEDAWANYYKANRYSFLTYKDKTVWDKDIKKGWKKQSPYLKELDDILVLIKKHIPGTYTDLRYFKRDELTSDEVFKRQLKAYAVNPNNPDLYEDLIVKYEMRGNSEKRKEFSKKLFESNYTSSGLLNYSYNLLQSLKPNAVIFTFGDNDTFPLWLLQDALNIRTDVLVLNVYLIAEPKYQKQMFAKIGFNEMGIDLDGKSTGEREKMIIDYVLKNINLDKHPIYLGTPAWQKMQDYGNNLFLVGIALEYSPKNVDNIAALRNNFENKYALDYLSNRFEYDMSADIVNTLNVNYLPAIFKLYEHYKTCGDSAKAQKIKKLGLSIAEKVNEDWLNKAKTVLK